MKKNNLKIKSRILIVLLSGIFSLSILYSCDKSDTIDSPNELLSSKVVGTYYGTLKSSTTNQNKEATLTVTMQNDSLIAMHCVADNFDSTLTMQLYQNYDSIMVCYTGQDFFNEYGHNTNNYDFCTSQQSGWMNNNWMNDTTCCDNNDNNWGNNTWAGNDQWNAWTNHMNTQHNENDMHYGGFNPEKNSCNYIFSMNDGNNDYFEIFEGIRK